LYKIPANTLFIGQNQVFVPQCQSTNSLAAELMRNKDLTEGTIVITDDQTAGRGQRGNSWESEPSMNLTFSIILKPSFLPASDQFFLTLVVALALREFLAIRIPEEVKIKWPNDILIGDSKICGILIENLLRVDTIQHSIVGIGLNVNQKSFSMAGPTSMSLAADYHFDRACELNLLLEKLEGYYLKLRTGKREFLKQEYLDHLYWKGERHEFRLKDEQFDGIISGVDDDGRLSIFRNGEKISVGLKEISFVR
jgi:BirA family transcriptional regulator, biotin operon repressor / biotin---[acetyl-CoA-carboxylase] ligase